MKLRPEAGFWMKMERHRASHASRCLLAKSVDTDARRAMSLLFQLAQTLQWVSCVVINVVVNRMQTVCGEMPRTSRPSEYR